MKTQLQEMVSLLLAKELEIKELQEFILQLQNTLQAAQTEYAKLYKLHFLSKKKAVKVLRQRIGYNKNNI